ncbi:Co2+/Mg2+ efflux protein ApaG [Aquirufa rosea]|uniref:Co2+/Mg2+ efflux protein ApaG n=1 Tax=Aquirufa rosea TaxID=2509241 RepID=A0A4Q1C1T5_9BACT|nr:Co2+/Mg2+ efflux protein ApaG [Aquirufa rosea]RXK52123.1 Co2+/Mg2+ efflux protein ApaG [Aquirufa rosea]
MIESISNGFYIAVETQHMSEYEIQKPYQHFFSYQITIKNLSKQPAQLVSRFWKIQDGSGKTEHVNGLGVVGQQPIIEPNHSFTYTSGCPIIGNLGKMSGHYTFLNLEDQSTFTVKIPPFELAPAYILN